MFSDSEILIINCYHYLQKCLNTCTPIYLSIVSSIDFHIFQRARTLTHSNNFYTQCWQQIILIYNYSSTQGRSSNIAVQQLDSDQRAHSLQFL